jgi:hypothetical protein
VINIKDKLRPEVAATTNQAHKPSAEDVTETANAGIGFGLGVIPLWPGTAQAAVQVKRWLEELDSELVDSHWYKHPEHELGFRVGENMIAFRAKSKKARVAFRGVVKGTGADAKLICDSEDGAVYLFWLPKDTATELARKSNESHSDQIEILTGDAIVALPPSSAVLKVLQGSNTGECTSVGQAFVDGVADYNASLDSESAAGDAVVAVQITGDGDLLTATQFGKGVATVGADGSTALSSPVPVAGGKGGEGGVHVHPVASRTALTPFTALADPGLKNVRPDSDLSAVTPVISDSAFSENGAVQGGEGGEGGAQPAAVVAAQAPITTDNAIGDAGDDDDVLTPKAQNNPVITALEAAGLYLTPLGSGHHAIACPWANEHGNASGAAHSIYFEPNEFYSTGGFRCSHQHLERHTTKDLLEFLGVPNSEAKHKPMIRVVPGELYRVVAAAEMVLEARASYFQSGGLIVSIVTDPTTGDPRMLPTSVQALTSALSVAASFEKLDGRSGSWVACDPPNRYVGILFKKQEYHYLSALAGLARQPYFRETDGALVTQPGYDKASLRFGVFDPHLFVIPEPTREAALAALAMLADLLCEVRFAQDHDKSAAISAMCTATVRPSLAQAPGFHVTSVIYGSGKSYLCKIISAFAGPAESVKISFATTSEEATKSLMSVLVKNPAVVEFDDMTTDWIAHGIVNRMLTSENLTDRILGFSKTATVSTRSLFLSSGNNVGPVGDLLRRIGTIRIDPRCETPTTIEYKGNPAEAVRQNRAAYVSAVLTIMLAWRHAGSPRTDVSPIASYGGAWADYCRHPLIWLGLPDPATSLLEQVTQDPDSAALGVLLTEWHKVFGSRPMTVRKVISTTAEGHDSLKAALDEFPIVERGTISPTKLGQLLKKNANRLVVGFRFERSTADGRTAWRAVPVGTPPSPPSPPSTGSAAKTVAQTSPGGGTEFDPLDEY